MGGLGSLAVDCTTPRGDTSEQGPGGLANPRQPFQGKARKKKKGMRSLWNLWTAKDNCTCICFLLLKTRESYCYERKIQLSSFQSKPLQEPQGSLGYIRHEQYHQLTAETLPRGPASDRHFSASCALTVSLRENREVQVRAGAVLHTDDRGKKDPKYFRLTYESVKISLHLISFSQGWFSRLEVLWCSTDVAFMAQFMLICTT